METKTKSSLFHRNAHAIPRAPTDRSVVALRIHNGMPRPALEVAATVVN
jgi:hypothetical protein